MQTVLASTVVCSAVIGYFLAGESLIHMVMMNLVGEEEFASILTYLSITGVIIAIGCAVVISDDEDAEGEGGFSLSALADKAETLAKGVLYGKTGNLYLGLAGIYAVVLTVALFTSNFESEPATYALLALVVLNIVLPVITYFQLD